MSRITIHDWRKGHLDAMSFVTDAYYLRIANQLAAVGTRLSGDGGLDKGLMKEVALSLAYYFEDVISGIGVWQAFTTKHKELYDRFLPFYEIDEASYYPEEVNRVDVAFIVWLLVQKSKNESVINPENPFLTMLSTALYEVLDEAFERAPINDDLLSNLQAEAVEADFFPIKGLMMRLATQSFLLRPFIDGRREAIDGEIDATLGDTIEPSPRAYEFKTLLTFNRTTGPLSLYTKDWLVLMLRQWGMETQAARVAAIESLPFGLYLLDDFDACHLFVQDASGRSYKVLRDAFDGSVGDAQLRQYKVLVSSLVKYDGEWMPNGLSAWYTSRLPFDELVRLKADQEQERGKGDIFRARSKNTSMRYFKTAQDYLDWLKQDFGLSEYMDMPDDFMKIDRPAVYLSQEEGLLYVPGGARVIYDRDNPYYDPVFAEANALGFLISDAVAPKELVHYLVDHRMLPDAHLNHLHSAERGLELVQQNMDFLARCLRNDDY